jgi:hypothetical protein
MTAVSKSDSYLTAANARAKVACSCAPQASDGAPRHNRRSVAASKFFDFSFAQNINRELAAEGWKP